MVEPGLFVYGSSCQFGYRNSIYFVHAQFGRATQAAHPVNPRRHPTRKLRTGDTCGHDDSGGTGGGRRGGGEEVIAPSEVASRKSLRRLLAAPQRETWLLLAANAVELHEMECYKLVFTSAQRLLRPPASLKGKESCWRSWSPAQSWSYVCSVMNGDFYFFFS